MKDQLTFKTISRNPVLFLAFGFGSGLARKAPGTFGTLAAVPLYLIFIQPGQLVYTLLTLVVISAGIRICGTAAQYLGEHDYPGIVWDEFAGLLVTLWFIPFSWFNLLAGFVIFRLFDILKPWPIRWLDTHVEGGLGIMLDDIVAGIFAGILLAVIL